MKPKTNHRGGKKRKNKRERGKNSEMNMGLQINPLPAIYIVNTIKQKII